MSEIGKKIRLERITNRETKKTIIVPMDHGVTLGPIKGLIKMAETVNKVAEGGADAVLGHIGLPLYGHRGYGKDVGLILHLSASTKYAPDPNRKVLVNDVEEALKLGADAVSVHINIGAEDEWMMLESLGKVAKDARKWGMPLLAMMYPRGKKISSEHDPEAVALAARVGAELGADIVKTNYTGTPESFEDVVRGCPVPVVIAGGPKIDSTEKLLQMVYDAISVGGMGVSIGRNVFQAENPTALMRAIYRIVHEGWEVKEAMKELEKR